LPPTTFVPTNGNAPNGTAVTTSAQSSSGPTVLTPEADFQPAPPEDSDDVQDDGSILLPNAPMEDHR